jgi:hypothetical protein
VQGGLQCIADWQALWRRTAFTANILSQCLEKQLCCRAGDFAGTGTPRNGGFGQVIEHLKWCIALLHAPTLNEGLLPGKLYLLP